MGPIELELRQFKEKTDRNQKRFFITFFSLTVPLFIFWFYSMYSHYHGSDSQARISSALFFILSAVWGYSIVRVIVILITTHKEASDRINKEAAMLPSGIEEHFFDFFAIRVTERIESNFFSLGVRPLTITTETSSPERYVFTGATVGGVTTGGFTKIGGTKTFSRTSWSDYNIVYRGSTVYKIELAPKLIDQARQDEFVSTMLKGNTIDLDFKTMSQKKCQLLVQWLSGMETDIVYPRFSLKKESNQL